MKDNFLLAFKIESTSGTAESLDGSNVIETVDGVQVDEYAGDFKTRQVDGVVASPGEEVNTKPHQTLDTKVDMAGSGDAANPVAFGGMLEACGFVRNHDTSTPGSETETFTLDNNVTSPTLTLGRYVGNKKFNLISGARGNVSFDFSGYIAMSFNFLGAYNRPIESGWPAGIVYDNYAAPLPVNFENTVTCQLDGIDVVMSALSISAGSGVQMLNVPNQKEARHDTLFTTGSITILADDISTKDWFEKTESHNGVATVVFNYTHGQVSGNRINFSGQEVQLSKPKETYINGELYYQFDMAWQDNFVIQLS